MSVQVMKGKASEADSILSAVQRGRHDIPYFSDYFLGRRLHDKQAEWITNAVATINVLATANRWGKTAVQPVGHFHAGFYKTGAEPFYVNEHGEVDLDKFAKVRYETVHLGGEWETSRLVWDDAHKILQESTALAPFIQDKPRTLPPHITGINGFRWKFRTLGHDSRGVDGNSFYLVTVDEAGWIDGLEEMMQNVLRVRIADVKGRIWIVGTFKPGVSRDFYKYAVRAAAHTGVALSFDHRSDGDTSTGEAADLDGTIKAYLKEFGINLDEYREAIGG